MRLESRRGQRTEEGVPGVFDSRSEALETGGSMKRAEMLKKASDTVTGHRE